MATTTTRAEAPATGADLTPDQHAAEARDYAAAARNATTRATTIRGAAQHHRDAAGRNALGASTHRARAAELEAAAARHDEAAARHAAKRDAHRAAAGMTTPGPGQARGE